ncbi:MAG: 50S ribosomal protein L18e [Candidatus Bathyarchaeota archaeon]|jgi:large subunit ribosomal protein L18e|nr:50S ribosomal protein L18e [Candidatus Bathyarchaeota archaeon]
MKTETTNPQLIELARFLKKHSRESGSRIWQDIAERLVKPKRKRITVNLSRLNRYTEKNETVAVPGKVLAAGELNHPLTIAAFSFSAQAQQKIEAVHGKCLTFFDLVKKNPKGSKIKIVG